MKKQDRDRAANYAYKILHGICRMKRDSETLPLKIENIKMLCELGLETFEKAKPKRGRPPKQSVQNAFSLPGSKDDTSNCAV